MSRAALIMDMPSCCYDCRYCNGKEGNHPSCVLTNYAGGYQTILVDGIWSGRSMWCPLRELPEKKNIINRDNYLDGVDVGWNACLNAIERCEKPNSDAT